MKKTSLILLSVAVIAVMIISRPKNSAVREVVQSDNVLIANESSVIQTNLHFGGLHLNPNIQ
jgi:hypothetical protein